MTRLCVRVQAVFGAGMPSSGRRARRLAPRSELPKVRPAVVAGVEVPNPGHPEVLSAAPHLPVAESRLSQPALLASQRL